MHILLDLEEAVKQKLFKIMYGRTKAGVEKECSYQSHPNMANLYMTEAVAHSVLVKGYKRKWALVKCRRKGEGAE